jgi:hypothetical protein
LATLLPCNDFLDCRRTSLFACKDVYDLWGISDHLTDRLISKAVSSEKLPVLHNVVLDMLYTPVLARVSLRLNTGGFRLHILGEMSLCFPFPRGDSL